MKDNGLISSYPIAQFKLQRISINEAKVSDQLNCEVNQTEPLQLVVSDLTYIRVDNQWNYVYVSADLFNREIIDYSEVSEKM